MSESEYLGFLQRCVQGCPTDEDVALKLSGMSNGLFSVPIKSYVSKGHKEERSIVYDILNKKGEILLRDFQGWDSL